MASNHPYNSALFHARKMADRSRLQAESRRLDAQLNSKKMADAKTARFLALGMKNEAHRKNPEYPALTPDEVEEASALLAEFPWATIGDNLENERWMASAAAQLDIGAFKKDIEQLRQAAAAAAADPGKSVVDAVFEAHALASVL